MSKTVAINHLPQMNTKGVQVILVENELVENELLCKTGIFPEPAEEVNITGVGYVTLWKQLVTFWRNVRQ